MSDDGSAESNSLMRRRIRAVLELDATATALTFRGVAFPWSFYSDAIAALESSLAGHPRARQIGIVLRNRPGPLAALIATIGTGREVVTLSPHLGTAGLAADIVDTAPDVIVAEDEDWTRVSVLAAAEKAGVVALRAGSDRALGAQPVNWPPNPALRHPEDVAVLLMTSGTTGRPKTGGADPRPDGGGVPGGRAGPRRRSTAAPGPAGRHLVSAPRALDLAAFL